MYNNRNNNKKAFKVASYFTKNINDHGNKSPVED